MGTNALETKPVRRRFISSDVMPLTQNSNEQSLPSFILMKEFQAL